MVSPVIFKTELVTKKDWYARIKQIMIEAGWENISSKPSVDYDVMFSTGESGDKSMVIQMKEFYTTAPEAMSNSAQRTLDMRLPLTYTPGAPGVAGVFGRPTEPWRYCLVVFGTAEKEVQFYIHYHCNKNRLILFNEFPTGMNSVPNSIGTVQYLGISDQSMGENNISAPIIGASQWYSTGTLMAAGHPASTKSGAYAISITIDMPPVGVGLNSAGQRFMSRIAYSSPEDGVRGFIDGVYGLDTSTKLITGDKVIDENGIEYRVMEIDSPWGGGGYPGSFNPLKLFAFRVE
jgi:hypothetical protein